MTIDEHASTLIQRSRTPKVPGYRIHGELGRGGMGVVYRATHLKLQREVALKVVLPSHRLDTESRLRFLREARTVAHLNHPHVVQAYDAGSANGMLYLALELVDGEDLRSYLRRQGRLDPQEATQIVLDAARGLAHAHASPARVIHRDVKPSNLLRTIDEDGNALIKLTDFGLARSICSESDLTKSNVAMGSPRYMSPEQALGQTLDHRSDIYSLGATFYESLVGRLPFSGPRVAALSHLVTGATYTSPSKQLGRLLPRGLERVLARMLAPNRNARYSDYASLITDLEAVLEACPAAQLPWRRLMQASLVGCATALVGLLYTTSSGAQHEAIPVLPHATAFTQTAERSTPDSQASDQQPRSRKQDPRVEEAPPPAPAPVERCSMQLRSGVEGTQAFVDGVPVALPSVVTAVPGAELEVVVIAPNHLPLRRVVTAEERTLHLDPHPSSSQSPGLARGRLFPEPPRVAHSREIAPMLEGKLVAVASSEPRRCPTRVSELVATGDGWARLPLWAAATALAKEQGQTARGWAFDFGLEATGQATLEIATLSGEGRDLVLRVRGARLELGARSADGYVVVGVHDLLAVPSGLRLEWTGTYLRVSHRAADALGRIFEPVFSHRVDWSPTDRGARVRFFELSAGAEAKLTSLDVMALGDPVAPPVDRSTASERLRLTSSVAGARAFVRGAVVDLPHELSVNALAEVQCVVVAPGYSPLRRVLRARGQGEVRLDPIPQEGTERAADRTESLAVFPWLPEDRQGMWHVAERISPERDRRVQSYMALAFDNPQGASMTAALDRRLAALTTQPSAASRWSLDFSLEFDGAGTFVCTPLRGPGGELSLRLRGTCLELTEQPPGGEPCVVATHDLVSPPVRLRLEWNGTTARVSAATLLDRGRLLPALRHTPRSTLQLGAASFQFADLENFAILTSPRVTLLRP